ncbi:hypothetical protein [Flaviaesturariibacter amylovorans]|uniref:hypothetical protein n=1 Tax=Flaviaesturariibacter amylovorans TaxID=1084520 RepID=UPI0031E62799
MRSLKFISCLFLNIFFLDSFAQENVTGFLLLSPSRNHSSFDLFLPHPIDSTKSLRENLAVVHKDTALQIWSSSQFNEPTFLEKADSLLNEYLDEKVSNSIKLNLVLVVEAEYNDKARQVLLGSEKDSWQSWKVIFAGYSLFDVYNAKRFFLDKVRVISLPRHGG